MPQRSYLKNYEEKICTEEQENHLTGIFKNIKSLDMKIIISGGIILKMFIMLLTLSLGVLILTSGVESSTGVKDLNLISKIIEVYKHEA